jgi:membrane associated rhomboid family serine protease
VIEARRADSTYVIRSMKPDVGIIVLVAALLIVFSIELATHTVGSETLLLKLGALPDNAELHGEYWPLATYSFLHLNGTHLLVNAILLFWVGRIVESRVILTDASAIYVSSVLCSAAMILFVHHLYPKIVRQWAHQAVFLAYLPPRW